MASGLQRRVYAYANCDLRLHLGSGPEFRYLRLTKRSRIGFRRAMVWWARGARTSGSG